MNTKACGQAVRTVLVLSLFALAACNTSTSDPFDPGGTGNGTGTRHFSLTAPPTCALVDDLSGGIEGTCTVAYSGAAAYIETIIADETTGNPDAISVIAAGYVTTSPAALLAFGFGPASSTAHVISLLFLFDFDPETTDVGKYSVWYQSDPLDSTYTTYSWTWQNYTGGVYTLDENPVLTGVPVGTATY